MTLSRIGLTILCMALTSSAAFPVNRGPKSPPPIGAAELAGRIDTYIEAALAAKEIEPAPLASDAEFQRRLYLDLAGRIPSTAEARAFLADRSPDRRAKLVEKLLASPLYVQHLANTWQDVMAPSASNSQVTAMSFAFYGYAGGQAGFRSWLEAQVKSNAPYDKMVRQLLSAPIQNVAVNYNYYPQQNLNLNYYGYGYPYYGNYQSYGMTLLPFNTPNLNVIPGFNPNPMLNNRNPYMTMPAIGNLGGSSMLPPPISGSNAGVAPTRLLLPMPPVPVVPVAVPFPQMPVHVQGTPGPYFFEANDYKAETIAASTSRRFLGVRLECAECHNHPFAKWTRKNFWEFAAFFSGVQRPVYNSYPNSGFQPVITNQQSGRALKIPGTDKIVQARFLDGQSPRGSAVEQTLAQWLTSPTNPYFARTGANRLWAHFFGVGIIDPIDDEPTDENPASHPELLAELTAQFVAHKFDVKYVIRAITASRAYQRASAASGAGQNQPRLFARMPVKGITPEQFFDSLALATGCKDPTRQQARADFLAMFRTQDKKTETQTSILQALTLMNGKIVADATSLAESQQLTALLSGAGTNAARIETLYLSTLSRLPRGEETARMLRHVESQRDSREAFADIFWALLNSAEFRFNH